MKLTRFTSIPQAFRNVRRATEILSVLSKYGLADWISRLNIGFAKDQFKDRAGEAIARQPFEARIRMAATELGPTFIKLGQLFSMRPEVVGVALAAELKQLQTDVPVDPFKAIRKTIETELGQPLEDLFLEFSETPLASASIGQAHRARLRNQQPVVVKVQHAGIERTVHEDLEVLSVLAQLAEHLEEFAPYRPSATIADMSRSLRRELDFGREERNLTQFAARYAKDPTVHIPQPFSELSTSRVLTMEYVEGIAVQHTEQLAAAGHDLKEIARRGATVYMQMIFEDGFYHADPHPGNIVILPGDVIGLLDFGMVGRLDDSLREDIEDMLMSIVNSDVRLLTKIIKKVGSCPPTLVESALAVDVADFVGNYSTQNLQHFDMSGALNDMTEIMRRHGILLPSQVGLLIKALVTLEGTSKSLAPDFNLIEVMAPFHRRILLRRFSPTRQLAKFRRLYFEVEQLVEVLPQRTIEILDQIKDGSFDVHLDHRGLEPSVNRLVLGLLASALFVGSAMMLSSQTPPLLFPTTSFLGIHKLSVLGLAGCAAAILIGMRLLRAIRKSGHLDRRDK
jgi:ubiquinone biosynthesis protein